jgi:hypothetical protein
MNKEIRIMKIKKNAIFLLLFSVGFGLVSSGLLSWLLWEMKINGGRFLIYDYNKAILWFEALLYPVMTICCLIGLIYLMNKLFNRKYKKPIK